MSTKKKFTKPVFPNVEKSKLGAKAGNKALRQAQQRKLSESVIDDVMRQSIAWLNDI